MGWLSGWNKRIKLTIDHNKIDADLSHFPVTVIGTSTHLEEVFAELSDANRKKIAFTKADGITQLYGEIELYDQANQKAVWHVSASGWAISNSVDTDFYIYYGSAHADNITYIGDIGARTEVWDSGFKAVYHMVDKTISTIIDSTSNNNDGTKIAANEPIEADGKIGKGQDFDGDNDYVNCGNDESLNTPSALSFSFWFKAPDYTTPLAIICKYNNYVAAEKSWQIWKGSNEKLVFRIVNTVGGTFDCYANLGLIADTWYHVVGNWDGTTQILYVNGVAQTDTETPENLKQVTTDFRIGYNDGGYVIGLIDETRISNIDRSVAWIKASYNSENDTLLTYGSEELTLLAYNAIFFGCNF